MSSYDISYTYDGVGNRLTQTDNLTSGVTTYAYDAANRLLTEVDAGGTTTYSYDADGNRTKKETPTATTFYSWNEDNRMIEAEPPSGEVTMTYDANGKRVKKETPTETKKYIYDFEKLLQETDGNDDTNVVYTATLEEYGDLVSEFDGSASSYHQYDALGSTDAMLDDNETVTDRYKYCAFGIEDHESGSSDSPFTFVGRQNYYRDSEFDLYLAGLRHYDPAIGQWVSDDPIGFEAGDVNLRRYARNNPGNRVDPSGLKVRGEDLRVVREKQRMIIDAYGKSGARVKDAIEHKYIDRASRYIDLPNVVTIHEDQASFDAADPESKGKAGVALKETEFGRVLAIHVVRTDKFEHTLLHEMLHGYSVCAEKGIPDRLSEGLTEYFTVVLEGGDPTKDAKSYVLETTFVAYLAKTIGEDALARLYFEGDLRGFERVINGLRLFKKDSDETQTQKLYRLFGCEEDLFKEKAALHIKRLREEEKRGNLKFAD